MLVDIDKDTLNLDVGSVERALEDNPGIKAIIPVHFAGQSCLMDPIQRLADAHSLHVIDDAAHAVPTTYQGRKIGNISDATAFSFYVTKTLATGEGGMITTNDDALAERVRVMRLHGISKDVFDRYAARTPSWYYEVVAPGFKYNMTDISASLGIHQLRKADQFQQRRKEIAMRYNKAFANIPVDLPCQQSESDTHAWHIYLLRLKEHDRDEFIARMSDCGIGTSVHFIPLHLHPYWKDRYQLTPEHFPVATDSYRRAVSLPLYSAMDDDSVERVIRTVVEIVGS